MQWLTSQPPHKTVLLCMTKRILFLLLLAFYGLNVRSQFVVAGANNNDKTESSASKPAFTQLKMGEELEIKLESNPTTGFQWIFTPTKKDVVTLISQKYVPSTDTSSQKGIHIVGKGGISVFKFKATKKGSQRIRLLYRQAWDKKTPAALVREMDIKVQ